ncbi:MAG: SHOCT domain-containing protein [Bifidobacteriaceae bacterium]|jgi:hypothetical protein|nr:SHOCT domain-containing protein [Bifidobacteriaceae bacterium]
MATKRCAICGEEIDPDGILVEADDAWLCSRCGRLAGLTDMNLSFGMSHAKLKVLGLSDVRTRIARHDEVARANDAARDARLDTLTAWRRDARDLGPWLAIDDAKRQIMIHQTVSGDRLDFHIVGFDDVLRADIVERQTDEKGIGNAVVGGLIFGVAGALIGGQMDEKTRLRNCTLLRIRIDLRHSEGRAPQVAWLDFIMPPESFDTASDGYAARHRAAEDCLDALRAIAPSAPAATPGAVAPGGHGDAAASLPDQLARLGALFQEGTLTEDEFTKAKAKLLAA